MPKAMQEVSRKKEKKEVSRTKLKEVSRKKDFKDVEARAA